MHDAACSILIGMLCITKLLNPAMLALLRHDFAGRPCIYPLGRDAEGDVLRDPGVRPAAGARPGADRGSVAVSRTRGAGRLISPRPSKGLFLGGLRPPKPSHRVGLWGNRVSPHPSPRAYAHVRSLPLSASNPRISIRERASSTASPGSRRALPKALVRASAVAPVRRPTVPSPMSSKSSA